MYSLNQNFNVSKIEDNFLFFELTLVLMCVLGNEPDVIVVSTQGNTILEDSSYEVNAENSDACP